MHTLEFLTQLTFPRIWVGVNATFVRSFEEGNVNDRIEGIYKLEDKGLKNKGVLIRSLGLVVFIVC